MLNDEERLFAREVDRFCRQRVQPRAAVIDRDDAWFPDLLKECAALGLQGILFDEDGRFDPKRIFLAMETTEIIASYSPSVAIAIGATRIHTVMLARYAARSVRERWLDKIVAAEAWGSFALSEPNAGSDVRGIRTVAVRENGGWRINGSKMWTTLSPVSSFTFVLAKVDSAARDASTVVLLVERGMDGVSYGPNEPLIGYRGVPMANVYMDSVLVPDDHRVGDAGILGMFTGLNYARIEAAALGAGIMRGCLRLATAYARERVAFSSPIARHQAIQLTIGQIAVNMAAAQELRNRASRSFAEEDPEHVSCSIAKVFSSDTAMDAATRAVSIFGANGVTQSYEIERYLRDAKATQIFDGTSDILHLGIGRDALARSDW